MHRKVHEPILTCSHLDRSHRERDQASRFESFICGLPGISAVKSSNEEWALMYGLLSRDAVDLQAV